MRGQELTPIRRQRIQEWEERVFETGATVDDVVELEKVLKHAIILRDIASEDIYNSGKYQFGGKGVRSKVELICHNGHAWSKDLHFPQSREVHIYELLFLHHKDRLQDTLVTLLNHPKDSRKQNIQVTIPGTGRREELVLNDTVDVSIEAAGAAIQTDDWRLGYALTVHSSQGLTMHDPQKVWIIRRLPPVVQPCLPCGVPGGVQAPARTGSLSPKGGF